MAEKQDSSGLSAIQQFLNTAPTLAVGSARAPLGPPQGFYAEQGEILGAQRDPSFTPYVNGDEWVPAYGVPPEDRERLKARMNAAGLYGTTGYQSGSWTREDANAYQQVLEAANGMGVRDANVVIDNIAQEVRKGPRVQGPRAPLVSRITDPNAVRAIVRSSALDLTGSRLSDEDERRIVDAYRSYQQGLDQSAYAAGAGGGTVASPMDPQTFAEQQVEQTNPAGVASNRYLDGFEKLIGVHQLGGNVSLYGGAGGAG